MIDSSKEDAPSALYRIQIANIASRMNDLIEETIVAPLQNMTAFNQFKVDFSLLKKNAYTGCRAMDVAQTIKEEDDAIEDTSEYMRKLVFTKNKASDLIENDFNLTLNSRIY